MIGWVVVVNETAKIPLNINDCDSLGGTMINIAASSVIETNRFGLRRI